MDSCLQEVEEVDPCKESLVELIELENGYAKFKSKDEESKQYIQIASIIYLLTPKINLDDLNIAEYVKDKELKETRELPDDLGKKVELQK